MSLVLYEQIAPHIAKITLNDPDSLNPMSEAMADELQNLTKKVQAEILKPRAIILTGAGRAFSAGGSLDMLEAKQKIAPDENQSLMLKFYNSFLSIRSLNIPLIAAINGHAVGAGLCLASACDIRLAADSAKLGFTFVKLGLHPGMGATYFLPKIIGLAKASELLFTGRMITAEEALQIGLVSRVCTKEDLLSTCLEVANEISTAGPLAVADLVASLRGDENNLQAALEKEALCQSRSYASAEFKEGVSAAKEKRSPNF